MTQRFATVAITLAISGSLLAGSVHVRSAVVPQALKLSFQPYAGEQHESMPVEVLKLVVDGAFASTLNDGVFVHEWRLRNRSDKTVVRLRSAFFVYRQSEPEKLLLKYTAKSLVGGIKIPAGRSWPAEMCVGYWCPSEFSTISARRLLQPLFNENEPEGAFIITMGIDKVWFEDGTTWELETAKTIEPDANH
jgi:hypothetical protein